MADCMKVYANAAVTLKLHYRETDNGFDMKFYEIPAAGGYLMCDWQQLLQDTVLDRLTTACRTTEELLDRIRRVLHQSDEGADLTARHSPRFWHTKATRTGIQICSSNCTESEFSS